MSDHSHWDFRVQVTDRTGRTTETRCYGPETLRGLVERHKKDDVGRVKVVVRRKRSK